MFTNETLILIWILGSSDNGYLCGADKLIGTYKFIDILLQWPPPKKDKGTSFTW
jgi:hypothetical protein